MSLREIYAKAWVQRRGLGPGWIVNLEPTYNLELGAVGMVSGIDFQPETTLSRRGVTGLAEDPQQQRSDTPWQFQSNDQISVEIASAGQTSGVTAAVGEAGWQVTVSFGEEAGVSIYGTAMWWRGYADIGVIRAAMVTAARTGRLHKGEAIVVSQQLTGPGVLFTAEGHNASLRASAAVNLSPGSVPTIASLGGKLSVVRSSAGAQMQAFPDGAVLSARVLYLGYRGWLWWRDFEAYGASSITLDQVEEVAMKPVEGDGDDQYFALV
jgi:hypothetical protein